MNPWNIVGWVLLLMGVVLPHVFNGRFRSMFRTLRTMWRRAEERQKPVRYISATEHPVRLNLDGGIAANIGAAGIELDGRWDGLADPTGELFAYQGPDHSIHVWPTADRQQLHLVIISGLNNVRTHIPLSPDALQTIGSSLAGVARIHANALIEEHAPAQCEPERQETEESVRGPSVWERIRSLRKR
jgi:hypothetical protein